MIGRYSDEMTFDYIMNRMLESVPDTVDKREGSIIYDALAPAAAELVKCYMELDVVMDETFVDTASLQYLMLRCKERGVAIQGETAAVIEGVFTPSNIELSPVCGSTVRSQLCSYRENLGQVVISWKLRLLVRSATSIPVCSCRSRR